MMKKKKIFFGALGLLALASCSSDELVSVNRDGDEIAFSVVTNSATRAADVYCNNNLPNQFKVWATHNPTTGDKTMYIGGDLIEYSESKWVNSSGTRYWPDDGSVTFFASHNADNADNADNAEEKFKYNNGSPIIESFTVPTVVSKQKDLIYAVKTQSKSATDATGKVTLNFRHALSQIVFRAKNTNENLYVEIRGVSVCNVKNKGTFTYPTGNTDDNIEDKADDAGNVPHDGTFSHEINHGDGSWGTWVIDNDAEPTEYRVTFNAVGLGKTANQDGGVDDNTNTVVSLTNNATGTEFNSNAMLLLPQPLNVDGTGTVAWDVTKKPDEDQMKGTYFLVNCRIFNVAGTFVDTSKDVCLWGKKGSDDTEYHAADVAIPVSLNWEQGKKYIYTFVFGEGNGGYNPDPDDPYTPPTPVLVPITFGVTVDDFVSVDKPDINMSTTE